MLGCEASPKASLMSIKEWRCPLCYTLPEGVEPRVDIYSNDVEKMGSELKRTLTNTIKTTVRESLEKQTKTWSEVLKQGQSETQRAITTVIQDTNTDAVKSVVTKSRDKMDSDHVERERRRSNVMIRDVPESESESNSDKIDDD